MNTKFYLLFIFGAASLWDGFTTTIGLVGILDAGELFDYILCVMGGVIVLGFSISTRTIWANDSTLPTPIKAFMGILWVLAIGFDMYTSFVGNAHYLSLQTTTVEQLAILLSLTIFVSSSPILFSYFADLEEF